MNQLTLLLVWLLHACLKIHVDATCDSTQYVELYQTGEVRCDVDLHVFDVFWYKKTHGNPIAKCYFENGEMVSSGPGYENGSYGIGANGSLIIANATTDELFEVLQVQRGDSEATKREVELKTVVTPLQPTPTIHQCQGQSPCVLKSSNIRALNCSFSGARPAANLTWHKYVQGQRKEMETVTRYNVPDGTNTFTSSASIDVPVHGRDHPALTRLVCKASGPALGSRKREATVLIDNFLYSAAEKTMEEKYYQVNSQGELPCGLLNENATCIWQKTVSGTTKTLYSSASNGKDSSREPWPVTNEGSLVLEQLQLESEGEYTCKSYDGVVSHVSAYDVHVVVPPSPPYIVTGCPEKSTDCEMKNAERPTTLSIKCAVHGVFPMLSLSWENNFTKEMTIVNQSTSTKSTGNRHDITTSAELVIRPPFSCDLLRYIGCRASGPGSHAISKTYEVIRIFPGECERPNNVQPRVLVPSSIPSSIAVFLAVIVVVLVIVIIYLARRSPDSNYQIIQLRNVRHPSRPTSTTSAHSNGICQPEIKMEAGETQDRLSS